MEILLEALHEKRQRAAEAVAKVNLRYYIHLAALAGLSFLLARAVLMENIYPCAPALVAALMSRGKVNIYVLPFIFLGAFSSRGAGEAIWGDMIAAFMCAVIFFLLNKRKLSIGSMALLAAGVTASVRATFLLTGQYYLFYDMTMLGLEVVLVFGLSYLFSNFFALTDRASAALAHREMGIVTLVGVVLLAISALGLRIFFFVSPVYVVAMLLTLFIGYKAGPMEGGLAGVVSGIVTLLTVSGTPAVIGIFACGGMVAGFLVGLSRIVAGVCFASVCFAFGMMKGYPELYLSAVDTVAAAALFIIMPLSVDNWLELLLAKVRGTHEYEDTKAKQTIKTTLEGYLDTFIKLSALYGRSGSSNSIIPMQFKAMARLTNNMILEMDNPKSTLTAQKPRYSIQIGISGYAKEDNISGDSYLCTEMKGGQYMIALSDGMGKGRKAAEESSLTLTTLHSLLKAGFDIELALKTINSLLVANATEEIFSTVDMGLFDRYTGSLQLFKIGAAATFLKRDEHVEAVKIAALPMGIVDQITVDSVRLKMKKGDRIIVVSDGITDADRNDKQMDWLIQTIAGIRSKDPQTMSDLIINKAIERYGLKEKDDMTVITAMVE